MELGVAGGGKNAKAGEVDVAVPTEEKDINAIYAAELKRLAQPAVPEVKTKSPTQKQEDYYKVSQSCGLVCSSRLTTCIIDIPNEYAHVMGCHQRWLGGRYIVSLM